MKFVAKADFERDGHPVNCYGPTLASMRAWVKEVFKSGSVPPGSQIKIYEIREVLVDCLGKPEPSELSESQG